MPPDDTPPAQQGRQPSGDGELGRPVLDQSLQLGAKFLMASQLPGGSFRYNVNFITGETAPEQNLVRQAGALWGLALVHQDRPSAATRTAVLRGLAFFERNSSLNSTNGRFIRYSGARDGDSGAVALVALTIIELLRVEPAERHADLRVQLDQYLATLLSLRRTDDRFHRKYLVTSGEGWGSPSPYADGEILLAMVKAVRYVGREDLRKQCQRSAEAMYQSYGQQAVAGGIDDPNTKGFFQWGCMAFLEMCEAEWPESRLIARQTVELAHWMIDVHRMPQRSRNTAYALEGIACAHELARRLEDQDSVDKFRQTIDRGLTKLTSWQVGGPTPSPYLQGAQPYDPSCRGGILGADEFPWLRIDTTQHQMHAVILARRYIWSDVGKNK